MTVHFGEVTQAATTTDWPWPWHPDIHFYHQYLNLSSVGPEMWDGLHLGVLLALYRYNDSDLMVKWVSGTEPNVTAMDETYRKEYEGTGRNMFFCIPQIVGKYPDWYKGDRIWGCGNYTPAMGAHTYHLKEWSFLYTRNKPAVDIVIGISVVTTTIGVLGK